MDLFIFFKKIKLFFAFVSDVFTSLRLLKNGSFFHKGAFRIVPLSPLKAFPYRSREGVTLVTDEI